MWQYYAFKVASYSISFLPRNFGYFVCRLLADTVFLFPSQIRQNVYLNQRHVFGLKAQDSVVNKAVRGALRTTVCNYFDLVKLPRRKRHDLERSIKVNGWEHLEAARMKGKGVVFVTAHLGSYDTAAQIFALKSLPTTVLVEPIKPPKLLAHITKLRQSHGVTFLSSQTGTINALFKCLHRGEAVLFASDRDIDKNGVHMRFFDKETTLPTIAVRIAMKTGASIVPIFSRRTSNGNIEIDLEPAIEIVNKQNDSLIVDNVKKIAKTMEKYIKRSPEQWVVLNPIWPNYFVAAR